MPVILKPLPAAVLGVLGVLLAAAPAAAQQLFLPLEAGTGVLFVESSPKPFTAAGRFHPALGFGPEGVFRVGPSFALAYANPDVSLQAGARALLRVRAFTLEGIFNVAEIDLAAEALWGTQQRNPVGGALLLSINRVAQFTLRGGYDLDQEAGYFGTAVGTDLSFLFGIRPKPSVPPPVPVPAFEGCYAAVYDEARVQAQAAFFGDASLLNRTRPFLDDVRRTDRFLAAGNLIQAKAFLQNAVGLTELAQQMDATLEEVLDTPACRDAALDTPETLRAFLEAWKQAVKLSDNR